MVPILLASVVAMAIVVERFWTLRRDRIVPPDLVVQVWQSARSGDLNDERIHAVRQTSPLGRVFGGWTLPLWNTFFKSPNCAILEKQSFKQGINPDVKARPTEPGLCKRLC